MDEISGMARTLPQTSAALVVGSLAIVGLPPFSLFVSEFAILSEAFSQARYMLAALFLVVLSVVFGGFAYHFLRMLCGEPNERSCEWKATSVRIHCDGDRWRLSAFLRGANSSHVHRHSAGSDGGFAMKGEEKKSGMARCG